MRLFVRKFAIGLDPRNPRSLVFAPANLRERSRSDIMTAGTTSTGPEARALNGAEIVLKALVDQGVDVIFGYPGGAVLPIYDALFKQKFLLHPLRAGRAGGGVR